MDILLPEILGDLQKIDAGIVNEVSPELGGVLGGWHRVQIGPKMGGGYYQKKPTDGLCILCGADILIEHHIMAYKSIRRYNGDGEMFLGMLGKIWLCPNCHYRVHIKNPYYQGKQLSPLPEPL